MRACLESSLSPLDAGRIAYTSGTTANLRFQFSSWVSIMGGQSSRIVPTSEEDVKGGDNVPTGDINGYAQVSNSGL